MLALGIRMTLRRARPALSQSLRLPIPDRLPLRRRTDTPLRRATAIHPRVRPQRTVSRPAALRSADAAALRSADPAALRSADPAALRSADPSGIPAAGLHRSQCRLPATGLPAGLRRLPAAGLSAVRRPKPAGLPSTGISAAGQYAAAVRAARLSAAAIRAARPDAGVGKR